MISVANPEQLPWRPRASAVLGSRRPFRRPPMLSNTPRMDGIVDILGVAAQYLIKGVSFALTTLGDIVDLPMTLLAEGVDVTFDAVAGLLGNVPVIGSLLSQIVLAGGAIIKFGLTVPGLLLRGLGNILEGIAQALDKYLTPEEKEKNLDEQKEKITEEAPDHIKDNVEAILDAGDIGSSNTEGDVRRNVGDGEETTGTTGTTDPSDPRVQEAKEETTLEKALPIALPVAAGGLLLAVLLA